MLFYRLVITKQKKKTKKTNSFILKSKSSRESIRVDTIKKTLVKRAPEIRLRSRK